MKQRKLSMPKFQPDRELFLEESSGKIIALLKNNYEISALDFLLIMEHAKEEGLRRFKL